MTATISYIHVPCAKPPQNLFPCLCTFNLHSITLLHELKYFVFNFENFTTGILFIFEVFLEWKWNIRTILHTACWKLGQYRVYLWVAIRRSSKSPSTCRSPSSFPWQPWWLHSLGSYKIWTYIPEPLVHAERENYRELHKHPFNSSNSNERKRERQRDG